MDEQPIPTIRWHGGADGHLVLLDQTRLPGVETTLECHSVAQTHDAIRRLVVRGAPAIGVAAAYGVCLAAARCRANDPQQTRAAVLEALDYLATSRPTAVNLFWALDRMRRAVDGDDGSLAERLLAEARAIHQEDRQTCRAIGTNGLPLLQRASRVLTHCNAGGLAASEWGTALAVIYAAHAAGQSLRVYADETRPLLQGARLTAWELQRAGVPVTVICDSMAGSLMRAGQVDAVIVGADRIAANGDVANKIGTYPLAILAHHHGIPFYVAAPCSTFDMTLPDGDRIPIEQRAGEEVGRPFGAQTVPDGVDLHNPAFDVTPARWVTAIVTERGVIEPVDAAHVAAVVT